MNGGYFTQNALIFRGIFRLVASLTHHKNIPIPSHSTSILFTPYHPILIPKTHPFYTLFSSPLILENNFHKFS